MKPRTIRPLAACASLLVTVAGWLAAGTGPAAADTCQRLIAINPEISVSEGTGRVIFTVFSGGCAAAGQVDYTVSAGSATPSVDYHVIDGRWHWNAGDTTVRRVIVTVARDSAIEENIEDFTITLTNPSRDVAVAHGRGHARILDDDSPGFVWVVDDQICAIGWFHVLSLPGEPWITGEQRSVCSLREGVPNTSPSKPLASPVSLQQSTEDGTAVSGVDYVGIVDQTLTAPVGATLVALPVELLTGATGWFYMRIGRPSAGTTADAVGTVTVIG